MSKRMIFGRGPLMAALLGLAVGACSDLLEVGDPQRYTADDLDAALEAVAAGVEGDLHSRLDGYVNMASLASDETQHTGTWSGWDDADHGLWDYLRTVTTSDGLLSVRWFAIDARARIERVLEGAASSSPMMAQVMATEAWSDLLNAQWFCESPAVEFGPAVTHQVLMAQARDEMTAAMNAAQSAGATDYYNWALAGRARAKLYLGDYAGAAIDAAAVPNGFVYYAKSSVNSGRQENAVVNLQTHGYNTAAGLREKWWGMVDANAQMMVDPFTAELDPRLPVYFDGEKAVDGLTDHYSQWKYQGLGDDIPFTDKEEMNLIQAEDAWRNGDMAGAQLFMNLNRTAAGLSPLPVTAVSSEVFTQLMHEQFAEQFLEGQRFAQLNRLQQVEEIFGALNDPSRGLPRPMMWTLHTGETRYNPEIADDEAQRCLPMSGAS